MLAKRWGAPKVRHSRRGSLAMALRSGLAANRRATLQKLRGDEFAPSGKGPRRSRWKLWVKLRRNWFGCELPTLPLTVEKLTAVMSKLKDGRYRSAADVASTAQAMHLRRHEWSAI